MDNSEDKKWLYDKLKAAGLGISYKDFENTLGNEEDLKWYYDRANNIGLQVGSYDDFSTLFSSKPAVSVAQQVIDEYDASMGNARSQEATNTQPSPSPTPAQPNMYDGSQFAQAFQAPDWRSEENKLMDEIATSGKATVATLDGVDRYPTKPFEVRYDESVREAASKATSQKQSAADQLNSLYDDINTQVDAIPRRVPRPYEAMAGLTDQQLEENRLRAAQRIVEDAKEVLEEAGKKGNTNFVAGLGRGIADKIADPENWNFGITDLADNKYLLDALKKSEKGEELTPAEDKLLQAATTSMAVNYYYSQDLGRGYKAGKTTAESIPFMLEFMINPVSASGSGIAKSLLKYGMKKFGAKAVNRGITRAAGRLIGDAAAAAGMTATTGAARTLASSYEKQAENYDYRYDDTGNVVVQKTGDMGQGEALARGFLSNFLENQSEMVFGAFSGAGKSLSGIIPSIGKLSNSGLVRFYNSIKNAPLAKQLRDRAKIGGVVEEYAEEVYNNFSNVATGEMSAEDALSIDNNIDTFLGLVPTQLAFSAIGLGGLARENMAARKRIRAFEAGLSEEEKNVLTQLQDAVRSGDNNVARDYIKATLADNSLTDQEKKERIFAARDIVTAQQAEQLEQEQTVTEQETDASYAEGASADPSTYHERYKASQQAGAALEQVDPSLYDTINRYVEDDASAGEVDNLLSGLEGETEQLARTYLNSLMQLKGAEDSQMQDAVEAVDAFDQSIQPYAYQNEDGTRSITTGTYKDRPVYVIPGEGGNATVVYEDGSREMALSQYVEGQETTDYDEFIDNYNRSYLEEKEAAFRNFLENHPKTQQPAPGVVLHNGDVTYVVTNVSEDGYVDIVPATFDAETGQTVPKNGAAQQTISYSTAMMLQNDYYSALDNQGNTSINTGDSSNLSENKAENETRPSDGESNVSKSAVEDTPEQRLANFVATLPKKGKTEEIDYNAMTPQQRYEYTSLIESPEVAAEDLQADISAKQKQLEAVQKKLDSAVGGKRTEIRDQIRKLRNELKELTDYYQSIVTPVQQDQVVPEVASQAQEETSQSLDNAVPDVVNDKASDARQRGYRMVNGQRVDRQEQIPMQQGRETDVRFSQNDTAKAKFAIVDATYLQPSHIGGVRNSLFFIDEAQPKDRVDNASVMAADRMARDIRPEEITGGVTAYTGSPVVNSRGEVIQGNNRSAALRIMYQIPGADATYREYLSQHAEEFGLTAEQINSVQSPVLVRVADVTDNEAIRLGQMTAQDTESGGIERIKSTQTATKLGDSLQSFNRILLNSQEEDVSLSDLVSENGVQALKFLRQQGSISDTQYQSAFDANGNLTPEAKQDLIAILQTSLFEGGPDLLPQMFRSLPAKSQKAILSTFVRDQQSPEESRIKKDIQNAIQAFYAAMQFPDFAKATNYESARNAIEQWKRQINMIDGVAPMQVFDNFALELAVRFKGYTMKRITDEFNAYYDLVQGAGADLFSETASPVERSEAISRIFNITTNEQEGNDAVGSDNTSSEEGRSGSTGSSAGGERNQDEGRSSDTGGRTGTTDESEQVETSLSESPESANERRMNQIIERLDEIEYRLSELEGKTDIFSEAEQITLNNEKNELESEFEGLRKINATSAAIQEARNDVNPDPTEAQKEAGNYKKGHVTIDGLNITIENPKGSTRSGKDASGKEWSVTMQNDYGYIRGTKAVDGDHIDIFLSDNPTSGNVYVVDAIDQKTGAFDESKVMYGFNSLEEARNAYLSNYSEGWKVGPITEVSKEDFKKWIDSSTRKGKPFGEYKSVKSNVTDPQQLPKILKDAYESEDKASITNAETLLREYVDGQNNFKQIYTTYFRSMDNLRKEKDKSSPRYKMNDFIAKTCKDALKKAGIAPDALMGEKKRMEFANATKDANVLDVMSVDPSFDVLKAVVRNPNTSNNTLQNIADNTNYSYLSDEARQILEERNSNQKLVNENQPNLSPNEPKNNKQEEVQVESKDKFVGYKEFIDNLFEQEELILTPYKNLSEWKEKDEEFYANRYDARIDEFIKRYVSYIKELSDNGTLQRIYDHSSLKNQKVIRDNLADAGIEYKDYIDTKVNRKRIPQKADEKSDLKEGSEVNARFYDGTIVSGTIESIENNKIGIRTNNGRLYNVPLNRILYNDDNVLFREVYHGSPADFDRFDHNFIGSGEGAQAYGWGTYVTEVNGIARSYAENLTGRDYTKQINRLAQHIEAQKEFIKTRKADIRKNEDYEKYAKSIRKNLRDSQKEYKSAERAGNEKDMEFYQSLINISNQQLEPEHHKHLIDSFWDDINNAQADIDKSNAEMSDLKNKLKDLKGKRNLYTVEIPEDTGENYLDWEQPISDNQAKMIEDAAKQEFDDEMADKIMRPVVKGNEFKRVYAILSNGSHLGSDKALSEFLSRAGFTGIKYPAEATTGGRADGARNYVIFNNKDLEITEHLRFRESLNEVNERFNDELSRYQEGKMETNDLFHLGNPHGVMRMFLPNLPIVMRQRVVKKGSEKKHDVPLQSIIDMPSMISNPIFVFQRDANSIGILTDMTDNDGKNVCVAIELGKTIQNGNEYLEVNDIRSFHGREVKYVVEPIVYNNTLRYANKSKGLAWLSSASQPVQQEIDKQDLSSATKIVENFENPKLDGANFREGQGPQTDASVSLANDPASRIAGAPRRSRKQQEEYAARERRRMENAANRMVEKLGLDNVEIVTDASTLEGRKSRAKGFYSPSTGKITIVLPNHVSSFDVEQTILHEAVAHYGLRRLFGDNFDTFLDNVYNNASAEIRERINALAKKYNGNYRTATEEYLASLAEKTDFENAVNSGWFNKIKVFFLKMLSKVGINIPELTDNELRYILWRSYENLAHPGHYRNVFDTAADVAKQNELKVGNYAESKLAPDVAAENDVLFRTSSVEDLLEDWHIYVPNGPNIHLINNEEDIDRLPYGRLTKIELKEKLNNKRCTGVYSNRNGSVFLFPNHMSGDTEELELTLWHETAHYASRQLGLDERLKNSCLDYIKNRYPDIYKEITSYYDRSRWPEEAVAYLFERKIKEFGAKKLLSSTFAGENDIAETFTQLINFIKNGKGNTESGRNSGSTGNTSGKNTERSVFGGRGNDLLDERRKIEGGETETDIYDDQELNIVNKEVGSAREQYERTLKTAAFKFTEAWQDSMLGLKEAQDAIAKATNSRILDYENAYIAENAMSSISLAEMDAFRNLVLKPILQEVNNLKKQGAAYEEITDYLMLKHGIERNREMAVREALSGDKETMQENMDRWNEEKKSVIESSGTWEEKQRQLDKIALTFGAELKDYSGMTDILNEYDNMEERTEEAYRIVNEFEEEYDTEALYDRIHAATDATLKKQVESGLMTKEMYQSISDMYEFYVPLRGWEEKTADEVYDYLTTEHSSFNAPVRKAKGRKSKADDPIANIANVAESGIVQGNRNLVKQRFLTMVQNHRTDLASVNNLWVQEVEREDKNGNTVKEWVAVFPEIAKDATPEQVERIMEAFNKRMEEKSKQEGSNVKRASDMVNIPYKILPKDLKEHQVVVKRAGKPYVITINGNPRAAQAINGLTNPNATENPFIKFVESANRFMAANFTQRNPAFVVANMVRDGIYANTSVWVKEGPLYAAKFNRNWAKSVREMAGLVARYKANRLDLSNPTDRMFYDFIRNGGETGYTFINSVEDYKGIIQKEIKRANRKTLSPMKAVDVLGNAMDTFGRWAEDASRFAAYRTSREMGRSVARSINDAKEISVNFNRKGAGAKSAGKWEKGNRINALQAWASQMARGLYIFWNAGVQGLTNFGRMARRNPGKFTAMASSYLVLGSLAPLINEVLCSALGGDDDDANYYNLPEYVRRNNICLYVGGSWLTIPLPIELRALYGLGEMSCSFLTGKEKYKPVKVAGQISQILPIDFLEGSGGLNAFVPSYIKPAVEVYNNKSWTGIPIYRDNAFNKDMPNWTKAYKSTSPELIELSERINSFTGGTKYRKGSVDINPAAIEYLFKSYLGGVATTIDQVKKTAMMPFNEDMQDWRNVVIANRFLKNADERSTQKRINNEYFENKEEFDKVRQEFNGYRKELSRLNPNMEEFAKYRVLMDELVKSDRFRKYQEFHAMDKELNRMFEAFKENGSEELEEQMYLKKEAMNEVARSK